MAFLLNDSLARCHHTKEEHETIGAFHGRHRVHEVLSINAIMLSRFVSINDVILICRRFSKLLVTSVLWQF